MTLGEKVKARRKELGMTQEELGKRLNTTKQTIGKYESGIVTNLPLKRIKELADALNVEASYLMDWEHPYPESMSDVKKAFLEEVMDMPDEKVKALIAMMKAFKES